MSSNDKLVTSLAMLPPDCDVCLSSLVARYHCVCVHIRPRESSLVSRTNATNGSVPMFFRASHMITSQPSSIDLAGYLLPRYQVPPPPHLRLTSYVRITRTAGVETTVQPRFKNDFLTFERFPTAHPPCNFYDVPACKMI